FVSIAIAVVLTIIVKLIASDMAQKLHLRLFQIAMVCLVSIAVSLIVYGSSDLYLVTMGAGTLLATALAFFAGYRMRIESP
ncbi:hypothetical protein ABTK85_20090, partial [Acinetobacter baumannii]